MSELGKAYVLVVPTTKDIRSQLEEQIGGPLEKTGKSLGQNLGATMGRSLQSIGSTMTNFITKPALAAVTALGGATLFSGWKRMVEIDNAKVKLEAIGNSAKDVADITDSALESVKGTAYGMDAAMTTAASAVAAGVKPGQDLTKYLSAISDAAAVAGVDMSTMGAIFNKVATSGKAQNDVLRQMADAGIPIYQYLADQMGVTAGEVFELAKAGKVGLSDFQNAVTTHIGGAAKEMGSKTITGAISNIKAAISRIGANFLGSADDANSFAGKVLPMLNNLMMNLGPIEEKAKTFGAAFADGFQKFADAVSKIPVPVLAGIAGALVGIGPAIGVISKLASVMSLLGVTINAPVVAIGALIAAFGVAYARSETFRNALNNLVKQIGPMFLPVLKSVGSSLKVMASQVLSAATAVGDALAPVIKLLTPLMTALAKVIVNRLETAFGILSVGVTAAATVIKMGATVIQVVVSSLSKLLSSGVAVFKKFATNVKSSLSFSGLAAKAGATIKGIVDKITSPFKSAYDTIKGAIDKIKGIFPVSLGNIFSGVKVPHFKVSGGKLPWGIGGKGVEPSISVKWYQKAEQTPYIFKGATLFGAGERNDEILYGRQSLLRDIAYAAGSDKAKPVINNYITVNSNDGEAFARQLMMTMEQEVRAY